MSDSTIRVTDYFPGALAFTLSAEGGLSDDPQDPGGLTNLGLTLADLTRWDGHTASPDDVRALTPDTAAPIYRAFYWLPVGGPRLSPGVGLSVFDHGVNRGVRTSARILQRILGVEADGWIGPQTLTALTVAAYSGIQPILEALHEHQGADYIALGNAHFERGWLARCDARYDAAMSALMA